MAADEDMELTPTNKRIREEEEDDDYDEAEFSTPTKNLKKFKKAKSPTINRSLNHDDDYCQGVEPYTPVLKYFANAMAYPLGTKPE
jgi:hypothetical protein